MYKAVVVGCGRIGCGFDDSIRVPISTHVGSYQHEREIELVSVVDIDIAKASVCSARYNRRAELSFLPSAVNASDDLAQTLTRDKIDIVSICTPANTHLAVVETCVEHKVRAILCEKPIAATLEDARKIILSCLHNNVALFIGHQRRFSPLHRTVSTWVRNGGLGRIKSVIGSCSGGVLESGTHLFDLLQIYFGRVTTVGAIDRRDNILSFQNGTEVYLSFPKLDYSYLHLSILGTKGYLVSKNRAYEWNYYKPVGSSRYQDQKELARAALPFSVESQCNLIPTILRCIVSFLACGVQPIESMETAYHALEIAVAIRRSFEEGKPVCL